MALKLRKAHVTDIPAVFNGELDYIQAWEAQHEVAWRLDIERHLRRWVDNFARLTVAERAGEFAGYSMWSPAGEEAQLFTLNVSPAYRRSGIGRTLLDAYISDALNSGYHRFVLSVRPDNPARHLYEQAGFEYLGTDSNGYLRLVRQIGYGLDALQ